MRRGDADHRDVQGAVLDHRVEGGEHLLVGEIARDAEAHKRIGRHTATAFLVHGHSFSRCRSASGVMWQFSQQIRFRQVAGRLSTSATLAKRRQCRCGAAESGVQERLDQFPGERVAHHAAAEANHVQVVVLDPLVGRKCLVDQTCPNAGTLLAATHAPTPLPQTATPRSTSPAATARASGTTKSG